MHSDERRSKVVMGMMLLQEAPDIPDPLEEPIICVVCCEENGDT